MNRLQGRTGNAQRHRLEADVAARIEDVFERCPALHGFSVQPGASLTRERNAGHLAGDLFLSDLAFYPAQDPGRAAEQRDEISAALLELVDEHPEVEPLLRGRTFARSLH